MYASEKKSLKEMLNILLVGFNIVEQIEVA